MLLLASFAATSAAGDDPELNMLQYGLQLFVIGLVSCFYFLVPALKRRRLLAKTGRRRLREA